MGVSVNKTHVENAQLESHKTVRLAQVSNTERRNTDHAEIYIEKFEY